MGLLSKTLRKKTLKQEGVKIFKPNTARDIVSSEPWAGALGGGEGFTSKPLDQGSTWRQGDRTGGFSTPSLPKQMSGRPADAGRKSSPKTRR